MVPSAGKNPQPECCGYADLIPGVDTGFIDLASGAQGASVPTTMK